MGLVPFIVFLEGCSVNAFTDREPQNHLWLDELTVPARYGVPCFDKYKARKDKASELLRQFKAKKLTHVELKKELVVLCPSQPEFVIWLSNQAESSLLNMSQSGLLIDDAAGD